MRNRNVIVLMLLALAALYPAAGAWAGEKQELDEILRYDSEQMQTLESGRAADRDAVLDSVANRYLEFIRKYPRSADARNYLGGLYYDFGLADKAFSEWKAGLGIDPANPYLHNSIAEYYGHDSGQPARAIAETRKAIELKPDQAVFHFNLANYYDVFRFVVLPEYGSLEKVFGKSLEEYRRAIELDPRNYEYAYVYAATITYEPQVWKIEDPTPTAVKIKAWEDCLALTTDPQQKKNVEREIEKLKKTVSTTT